MSRRLYWDRAALLEAFASLFHAVAEDGPHSLRRIKDHAGNLNCRSGPTGWLAMSASTSRRLPVKTSEHPRLAAAPDEPPLRFLELQHGADDRNWLGSTLSSPGEVTSGRRENDSVNRS